MPRRYRRPAKSALKWVERYACRLKGGSVRCLTRTRRTRRVESRARRSDKIIASPRKDQTIIASTAGRVSHQGNEVEWVKAERGQSGRLVPSVVCCGLAALTRSIRDATCGKAIKCRRSLLPPSLCLHHQLYHAPPNLCHCLAVLDYSTSYHLATATMSIQTTPSKKVRDDVFGEKLIRLQC